MTDKRALKILFDSYWTSSGWKPTSPTGPDVKSEDFEYAKSKGVMFDPVVYDHDGEIRKAIVACENSKQIRITNGFLASLTTRHLELRSAFGSYCGGRWLRVHTYQPKRFVASCAVCGEIAAAREKDDISVLSFERFKWGGVRHLNPLYIGFDLEQFAKTEVPEPTASDVQCWREILKIADSLTDEARLSDLVKALASVVKENTNERRTFINILGIAAILQPAEYPGFLNSYVDHDDRKETPWYKDDWEYPVRWWRGRDGVNWEAVEFWFPRLMA